MSEFEQIQPATNERRFWVIDLDRVRPKKPTGYVVRFHRVTEIIEKSDGITSSWGTVYADQVAMSLRQVNSILLQLSKRMDMRAEVVPLWGPIG